MHLTYKVIFLIKQKNKITYYIKNQIEIIQRNCLEILYKLYDKNGKFTDFIFAEQPYFLSNGGITCEYGKMVKVNKSEWE